MQNLATALPLVGDIYSTRIVRDAAEREIALDSEVGAEYADALYRTALVNKPQSVLEIGMAQGLSSLAILTALRDAQGGGHLISIDPNQRTDYHGVGIANVARAGFSTRHTLIERPDYLALPRLVEEGTRFQFAYIDGWHTFDYTLLDFFYTDKMLDVGGIVGFNDCGWRSVNKVLKFVTTHRKYEPMDVGLRPSYAARNPLFTLIRRLEGRSNADRYFRKVAQFEPTWSFFARF